MIIKEQIDRDLKTALLDGNKILATTLRGLKAAILNEEIRLGRRDTGLADEDVMALLHKESKKRQESAELYAQGGDTSRQRAELDEKSIIDKYLPAQMSEAEVRELAEAVISEIGLEPQNMGRIIGEVKQRAGAAADGATIAAIVKEKLTK